MKALPPDNDHDRLDVTRANIRHEMLRTNTAMGIVLAVVLSLALATILPTARSSASPS